MMTRLEISTALTDRETKALIRMPDRYKNTAAARMRFSIRFSTGDLAIARISSRET